MKKQKDIIIVVLGIILTIVLTYFIKPLVILTALSGLECVLGETDKKTNLDEYHKSYYIENYSGDLDSNLSVFPDVICDDMKVKTFQSSLKTGLFDTDGYIVLEYTLDEVDFAKEMNRLSQLEMDIENYDGEVYTNKIMYTEDEYAYPAYITIDGYADTFEYALIDEENCRIVCVYLAYIDSEEFPFEAFLKLDKTCYADVENLDEFSMYTHSFDGGESYIEFDD